MRHPLEVGLSFGITSAIITTLGLIVGLNAGTHSTLVVVGGIIVIAVADAFSDAFGIHMAEESEGKHTDREVWEATLSTLFFKMLFGQTCEVFVEESHCSFLFSFDFFAFSGVIFHKLHSSINSLTALLRGIIAREKVSKAL